MRYQNVQRAVFCHRPNRFLAVCRLGDETVTAHVKNTGRCRELLLPGAAVWLEPAATAGRKTAWSLIGVEKRLQNGEMLINLDSQAPNQVVWEAVQQQRMDLSFLKGQKLVSVRREVVFEDSRYDLGGETPEGPFLVEVKGVTLERDGAVLFPDAPTKRGLKHLDGLCRAVKAGYRCGVVFVVQMEQASFFSPNDETHPAFGQALRRAQQQGVEIAAYCCRVRPDTLEIAGQLPVRL